MEVFVTASVLGNSKCPPYERGGLKVCALANTTMRGHPMNLAVR
jgi:hypothetical protein